jgi:4-hydroxybenzoate polyprenyltransferase
MGVCFSGGLLISSAVINGFVPSYTFVFYLSSIIWNVVFDTVYGFQDIKDDIRIGVKSFAIKI